MTTQYTLKLIPGGVKFYDGVFMNSYLQIQNGLSLGSLTGGTWTDKVGISSSTGNISTNGTITAAGNITGKTGSFTGIGKPTAPTAAGVYIGLDNSSSAGGIEICTSFLQYIDFTIPTPTTPHQLTISEEG